MARIHSLSILLFCSFFSVCELQAKQSVEKTLLVSGGKINIELRATTKASEKAILRWLEKAAESVSLYYGHYPVKQVNIEVLNSGDGERISGTTWSGRKIQMRVGEDVTEADLTSDWTATHEMFHLAFPQLGDNYDWMSEGLATYLEPLARARKGYLSVDEVWRPFMASLDKGRPEVGDKGLEHTRTWGRTYWGGAGFWFEADIEIRQKTKNKKSLDDAIRAILNHGGDGTQDWTIEKVISVGDQATGLTVLKDLRQSMSLKPGWPDFTSTFKKLGLSIKDDDVVYNDHAPLASLRRAMTLK